MLSVNTESFTTCRLNTCLGRAKIECHVISQLSTKDTMPLAIPVPEAFTAQWEQIGGTAWGEVSPELLPPQPWAAQKVSFCDFFGHLQKKVNFKHKCREFIFQTVQKRHLFAHSS